MPIKSVKKRQEKSIFDDEWPKAYPHGKKAFLKALEKASKMHLFDLEECESKPLIKYR